MKLESNSEIIKKVLTKIREMIYDYPSDIKIMEVCGTHTQAIWSSGITSLLPPQIKLLSGPGCPVCVTSETYIDTAIRILQDKDVILASFGDMMRVKGTQDSLLGQKTKGKNVVIVYSPSDVIELANKRKHNKIIFFAVGFETTAPLIALTAKIAKQKSISNLFFLNSLKRIPPVLDVILRKNNSINGIICPGHVASVMGSKYFEFVAQTYKIPAAVCGFEPIDIVSGIYFLVSKIVNQNSQSNFRNLYKRCVSKNGNLKAKRLLKEVFKIKRGEWRGIGVVEKSAFVFNKQYEEFDAAKRFGIPMVRQNKINKCECSKILMGIKKPSECKLFGKICNPLNPQGPCMVSTEGSCSVYYRYIGGDENTGKNNYISWRRR